ncbi:MAG: AI-2E family transporter [Myxococcales bacterium]|nr:AI-2E family transporter [Myxococcales bacterium]
MSEPVAQIDWRRFVKRWGFAAFVVVVAWMFRAVLLPFLLALVVAYVLAPVVERLARVRLGSHSLPRGAAVVICYLVLIGGLVLFGMAFLPRLSSDFARLGREAPRLWQRIEAEWTPQVATWIEGRFPALVSEAAAPEAAVNGVPELPPPPGTIFTVRPLASGDLVVTVPEGGVEITRVSGDQFVVRARESTPRPALEHVLRARLLDALAGLEGRMGDLLVLGQAVVAAVIGALMKFVLVLMVAAFILVDLNRVKVSARGLVPERHRDDFDLITAGVDRGLSGVIRGQFLICAVNFVLTLIGMLLLDVKYALLLSAIAGVMSLVPIFGSILSSIPIVVIALVSSEHGVDLTRALLALSWILGIHFVEANFLNPKIIGTSARIHPVLVIFALIAGEHTYGLVGALLAVPVASIVQTLFIYFRSKAWQKDSAPVEALESAGSGPA